MTTSTLSGFPAHLGQFLLSRFVQIIGWALARFMAAPFQNASIAILSIALAFSASNALFWQTGTHPAPIFATGSTVSPVSHDESFSTAPPRPLPAPSRVAPSNGPPVVAPPPVPAPQPVQVERSTVNHEVTNAALKAAQTVLQSLGLYDGKIDGFYGPATAQGIRAYELRNGHTPKGALTPEIISTILANPTARQPSAPSVIAQEAPTVHVEQADPGPVAEPASAPVVARETVVSTDPLAALTQSVAQQNQQPAAQPLPEPISPTIDSDIIKKIQRGLASLAFLHGPIDGVAGEATARAIRNFEVYNNYEVTGRISPEMLDLLVNAGASI